MINPSRLPLAAAIVAAVVAPAAFAAEIAYISSSSGYVLGGGATGTAVTENWQGQPPMRGFSGYGPVQQNGRCLTGRAGNQPLTWEACRNDAAQRWALRSRQLNNEGGWCADVQGNRAGAGVPVLAYKCSGAINQKFNSHFVGTASQLAAAGLVAPQVVSVLARTAANVPAGTGIDPKTGLAVSKVGGSLIGQDGNGIVAQGGGNLIAQGGGN